MRRAKLEGRRIGQAALNIDRAAVVSDRLSGISLTEVARKHHISRATVCRLVNESGGMRKPGVPRVENQEMAVPHSEASDLPAAA